MLLFKYFLLITVFVSAIFLRKKMMEQTLGAIHRGALTLNDRIEGWLKRQVETHPSSPYAQVAARQRFKRAEVWRDLYKKWRKELKGESSSGGPPPPGGPSGPGGESPSATPGGPSGGPRDDNAPLATVKGPPGDKGRPPGWMGTPSYRVPSGGPPGWMGAPTPSYWEAEGEQHGGPPDDGPPGPLEIAVRVSDGSGEPHQVSGEHQADNGGTAGQPMTMPVPERVKGGPMGNEYWTDGVQAAGQPPDSPLRVPAFGRLKEGPAAPEDQGGDNGGTGHGPQGPVRPVTQPHAGGPIPPERAVYSVAGDRGGLPGTHDAYAAVPIAGPRHTSSRYPEDRTSLQTGDRADGPAGVPGGHGHQTGTAGPVPRPGVDPLARAGLPQTTGANARPEGAATAAAPPSPRQVPKKTESGPGGPPAATFPSHKMQDGGGRPVTPADSTRGPGPPARLGRPAGADAQGPPESPLPPLKFKLVSRRRLKTEHNDD